MLSAHFNQCWITPAIATHLYRIAQEAVANAANMAYSISQHTDASANKGASVVSQTVAVMQRIARQMQEASEGNAAYFLVGQAQGSPQFLGHPRHAP